MNIFNTFKFCYLCQGRSSCTVCLGCRQERLSTRCSLCVRCGRSQCSGCQDQAIFTSMHALFTLDALWAELLNDAKNRQNEKAQLILSSLVKPELLRMVGAMKLLYPGLKELIIPKSITRQITLEWHPNELFKVNNQELAFKMQRQTQDHRQHPAIFYLGKKPRFFNHVLLYDDVLTTGASARHYAKKRVKAEHIHFLSVFRTPANNHQKRV